MYRRYTPLKKNDEAFSQTSMKYRAILSSNTKKTSSAARTSSKERRLLRTVSSHNLKPSEPGIEALSKKPFPRDFVRSKIELMRESQQSFPIKQWSSKKNRKFGLSGGHYFSNEPQAFSSQGFKTATKSFMRDHKLKERVTLLESKLGRANAGKIPSSIPSSTKFSSNKYYKRYKKNQGMRELYGSQFRKRDIPEYIKNSRDHYFITETSDGYHNRRRNSSKVMDRLGQTGGGGYFEGPGRVGEHHQKLTRSVNHLSREAKASKGFGRAESSEDDLEDNEAILMGTMTPASKETVSIHNLDESSEVDGPDFEREELTHEINNRLERLMDEVQSLSHTIKRMNRVGGSSKGPRKGRNKGKGGLDTQSMNTRTRRLSRGKSSDKEFMSDQIGGKKKRGGVEKAGKVKKRRKGHKEATGVFLEVPRANRVRVTKASSYGQRDSSSKGSHTIESDENLQNRISGRQEKIFQKTKKTPKNSKTPGGRVKRSTPSFKEDEFHHLYTPPSQQGTKKRLQDYYSQATQSKKESNLKHSQPTYAHSLATNPSGISQNLPNSTQSHNSRQILSTLELESLEPGELISLRKKIDQRIRRLREHSSSHGIGGEELTSRETEEQTFSANRDSLEPGSSVVRQDSSSERLIIQPETSSTPKNLRKKNRRLQESLKRSGNLGGRGGRSAVVVKGNLAGGYFVGGNPPMEADFEVGEAEDRNSNRKKNLGNLGYFGPMSSSRSQEDDRGMPRRPLNRPDSAYAGNGRLYQKIDEILIKNGNEVDNEDQELEDKLNQVLMMNQSSTNTTSSNIFKKKKKIPPKSKTEKSALKTKKVTDLKHVIASQEPGAHQPALITSNLSREEVRQEYSGGTQNGTPVLNETFPFRDSHILTLSKDSITEIEHLNTNQTYVESDMSCLEIKKNIEQMMQGMKFPLSGEILEGGGHGLDVDDDSDEVLR